MMPKRESHSSSAARSSKRQERQKEIASRAASASNASQTPPSIQPDFNSSCPYAILGVPRDATCQQIKLSYRKLALKHHPDRQSSEVDKKAAHKTFAAIGNAYEILGDEGRRREHDESMRQQQQQTRYGSSRGFDGIGSFGHDPFSMFNDPFFSSPFGGRRSHSGSGRSSYSEFHFTDPFELFEQFFAEEMGHHGQQHTSSSRSSGRGDQLASDPFFSSRGSMFGGSGFGRMMSGHFNMMDPLTSQMHSSRSMFGGFDEQQLMRSSGNGSGSSFNFMSSSSSSSNHGGHQSVSTSTRTTIVNGVRKTIKERTVVHPDGRVERQVETIEGDDNDAGRLSSSANYPALDYGGSGRRKRR